MSETGLKCGPVLDEVREAREDLQGATTMFQWVLWVLVRAGAPS